MTAIVSPALFETMMEESAERGPRVKAQVQGMFARHAKRVKRRTKPSRTAIKRKRCQGNQSTEK